MSSTDHDIIILGGGHNGLVAACYLAQAGMDVLLLECREFLGGACVTEELFPGYRFSACSYICHMLQTKVIDDLELRKHGFEVFPLEPSRFSPLPNGRSLSLWDDLERSQEEIGRFSKKDAESYPKWLDFWRRSAGLIHAYFLKPPPTISEIAERVRDTKDEALFDRLLTANMKDLVDQFFESDTVKGTLIQAQDVGDVSALGSAWCYAYIKCNMFSAPENVGIVKGGMGSITQAMAATARERGVRLKTGAVVNHVLVEDGTAIGVVMQDGTTIHSDTVVSNADPKRTFLKLVEPEHLEPAFVRRIKKLKTGAAYLKFHAALKGLLSQQRLRSTSARRDENLPFGRILRTSLAGCFGRPARQPAGHGSPSSNRLRPVDGTPRPSHSFHLGSLRTGSTEGRELGRTAAGNRRKLHRLSFHLHAKHPRHHGRLVALHALGHRTARRPDRWQHPPPGHHPQPVSRPAPHGRMGQLSHPNQEPLPLRRRHPSRR